MNVFLRLGLLLVIGFFGGKVMKRIKLPTVTGYIMIGLFLGRSGVDLLTPDFIEQVSFISSVALVFIAFSIGSEFRMQEIRELGKSIVVIAFSEAIVTFILVTGVMRLFVNWPTALILGAVSSATAPAATMMVLREYRARGPLTSTLLGVVAVDDAICLMIFAIASSVAKVFVAHDVLTFNRLVVLPLVEIISSVGLGAVLGGGLILVARRVSNDAELLTIVVAAALLITGAAEQLGLSELLCAMAAGVTVTNGMGVVPARRLFTVTEQFTPPIITAFFVIAGSRLDIAMIPQIGWIGLAYLVVRMIGKIGGASLGGALSKSPLVVRKYLGYGLLSQVGVAVGLAIIVSEMFAGTQIGSLVLTILLATTIVTEVVGPMMTRYAIYSAGEAKKEKVHGNLQREAHASSHS
jgi:Kef-type K+ transport system membrane component KefB